VLHAYRCWCEKGKAISKDCVPEWIQAEVERRGGNWITEQQLWDMREMRRNRLKSSAGGNTANQQSG
jgi:hypothetical protein